MTRSPNLIIPAGKLYWDPHIDTAVKAYRLTLAFWVALIRGSTDA